MHSHAEHGNEMTRKTIVPMLCVGMLVWTLRVRSSMCGLPKAKN
ncbi:hypothetical protein ALO62_102962 [Pseudomonas amygdali pv. myricae]|uniref:Uncharacterized protein n=3 Tax=Pseudomonas syringae group TaxID=136849 RepID=A0A3M5IUG8_PSEA0|nr:hypothetical protein ALO73_102725 [Pseudomonas syringae pv. daphniphylli]KPX23669.1 hypothetical protein ALO71_102460 [Pseudomonas amygdali pv. dendropanacis]KPX95804.1 hypothetical protein ALO62_102962 [Pseudomonas amygdali pv. myricae]KPY54023.1 hypothetical protein ALO48_102305 [Pseudomonas syringae pv. rhaphiolepidis]KPY65630.1 hypothetical protein ALO93_102506 [Pseudomonas amygdali pv. sesami]RMO13249.1 hypothetical protein ALQ45_102267 [Pseudomonas amygdali pv. morsprunorum]RMQ34687.